MLQRIRVAALALVLGAGALAAAPGTATAAAVPTISDVGISPAPAIVVFDKDVTVTFTFTTRRANSAELKLNNDVVNLAKSPVPGGFKWTGTKAFGAGAVGKWTYNAVAKGDGDATKTGTFDVVKALTTRIGDFDADPDRVSRGDTIKVSGRLVADGKGYDGQTVAIAFRGRGSDDYRQVAKVTTGRGGWFSARVRAMSTGWWRAEFAATATARGTVSDGDRVDVRRANLASRISGFDARPEPVDEGDKLRFTGTLRAERRGGLTGQRVSVFFRADGSRRWEYVTSDVTGRGGRFFATATAEKSGWWRAEYRGTRGVNGTVSGPDWVRVNEPAPPPTADKADTRLIRFNAYPEPPRRGGYLKFRGVLQVDDDGSWEGYAGKVALYFKPLGSRKWQYVKTTSSGDSGRLYTKARAWRSGHWKFVFRGDADTNGDDSAKDYVRVRR
ncbi:MULTISPECIES: hypothetical protein [Nonomuraea]|jgi:hypothetical protein|uniref:Htaa domain protein n=1 Tax=Nonomuraea salmonea TaxID=46181 RepID=A0ABV5NR00_9ACTN